ncbi:MAG: ParM/StbA family protein [Desulfobacteraceae bacterium]|nr:ParM/StbA family protein [Desulfobacteraceae bacterium]MCB9494523.1 ParM/StbA family protein [Desulfobacteraceae bacterium]
MEVLGIDVGFGFTKVSNGRENYIFQSVIGDPVDIQFKTNFGNNDFTDNLHVTIDKKSYFIGDYASKQSAVREFTLDQERLVSDFVRILAITAAGIYAEEGITMNVISGLPVAYLSHDNETFAKTLQGEHNVLYHMPDGSQISKHLNINSVQLMPQPLGSVFNILMDENGRVINRDLANQKVGVVDIGFKTTDYTVFDRMKYVERSSSTTDLGISRSFLAIAEKLKKESGIQVELYRLFEAVDSGHIKIKGKEYNIANLRDRVFEYAAREIVSSMDRLFADEWDMDYLVLTGGGAKALYDYIIPLVNMDVLPFDRSKDVRFNNVMGYLKYGKNKWVKKPVNAKDPGEKIEKDEKTDKK